MKLSVLFSFLTVLLLSTIARADDLLQKVKGAVEIEHHYIHDVLMDPEGYIHVIHIYAPPPMVGERALWYSRIDPLGAIVASHSIPNIGLPSGSNVVLGRRPKGVTFVLFSEYAWYTTRYVSFTPTGDIGVQRIVGTANGFFDACFDENQMLYVFLSGSSLYSIDDGGTVRNISEREGPNPFGLFIYPYRCHSLSGKRILVVSKVYEKARLRSQPDREVPGRLQFMIIGQDLSTIQPPRKIDVAQFADPPVSEIYFSRPQVFNATDGGAFVYLSSMKGSRVETFRIRFDKNGVLQKKPTANAKPLKAIEYSGGGVQLRLNKTIPYKPNPMEGTMLFGFDDDGNIQYVRSSVTFNVKKP